MYMQLFLVVHALSFVLQLIGPPGVGKTAILEGLASRIVAKEVPEVCLTHTEPYLRADTRPSPCTTSAFSRLTFQLSWPVPVFGVSSRRSLRHLSVTSKTRSDSFPSNVVVRLLTSVKAGGVICFIDEVRA